MNMSRIFILRPVMTTLLMAATLLFGILAYNSLPINDLPAMDFPTVTVSASLPGASPETMASAVATPLEKQFSMIAGLDSMSSASQMGQTSVTLQFDLNRKIDGAAQDVQAAIVAARTLLPTSMPTPPSFRKVNPADSPILFIALSSPTLPLYKVDDYAEDMLAPKISMIDGVAQVQVFGSQIYAPRVQVDPRKLAAFGIGFDEISAAIKASNVNLPTGTLYGPDTAYNIKANGQLLDAAAFRPLIVAYRNNAPVRLCDIGEVIDSVQTDKVASWYNNERAVILAIQKQPNTNTIKIVDDIKKLLPAFQATLPGSVKLNVMYDRSQTIRKSVNEVEKTLLITILLVILVIFLFLGNISTTIIASLALPISIFGTFAAMNLLGFTLNNISLMALTLCVGFVVDDAIVVLENIMRHVEEGEPVFESALKGAQEIGFTVVAMTVSLVAVFIPILLMGGVVGRLFFQFGATISVAIIISGFVSLSLTPMLCSRFLLPTGHKKMTGLSVLPEKIFQGVTELYAKSLRIALAHRLWIVGLFFVMVIATGFLLSSVPKGFIPSEDTGQINGTTQAQEGISFSDMVAHQKQVAAIVAKDPNIEGFMSSVGSGGPNGAANQGRLFLVLKPMPERKLKADEIIQKLRRKLSQIPGIKLFMQNPPSIRIGGQASKALYQLTLSSSDQSKLYAASIDLQKKIKRLPDLQDVNSDLQIKDLKLGVHIDRDKCSQLGLSIQEVQDVLNSAYASRQVSVIYTENSQNWVILEVAPKFYEDPSMLLWLRIRAKSGQMIPLSSVASVSRTAGPLAINHMGQMPAVTLSFNLKPGVSLSSAVDSIKEIAQKDLPGDVTFNFQGTAQMFESSSRDLGLLLILSILVIYIVLGILYESFIHPITILSGLPSAGLGALLTLVLFQKELDIYGFLGLILLIGIVKKNAIMMIDFAIDCLRKEKVSPEEAIYKACIVRFRPIMMTTLAALLGSLPIALGSGQGSEARQTLGLVIVGGLIVSQLVTLYITPVFYLYLEDFEKWIAQRRNLPALKEKLQ